MYLGWSVGGHWQAGASVHVSGTVTSGRSLRSGQVERGRAPRPAPKVATPTTDRRGFQPALAPNDATQSRKPRGVSGFFGLTTYSS